MNISFLLKSGLILIYSSLLFFCSCDLTDSKSTGSVSPTKTERNEQHIETVDDYPYNFIKSFRIGTMSERDRVRQQKLEKELNKLELALQGEKIYLKGKGSEQLYLNKLTPERYFQRDYLIGFYKEAIPKQLGVTLPEKIRTIRNKYAHEQTSILEPYFEDAFLLNNLLLFEYEGFVAVFRNDDEENGHKDALPPIVNYEGPYKADFELPFIFSVGEIDLHLIELPNDNYKLGDSLVVEGCFLARLPEYKTFRPVIFSDCMESGHCDEWLFVLDQNNVSISALEIYYNTAPDGNMEDVEVATYKINEDYTIEVNYSKVKLNYNQEVLEEQEWQERYKIDDQGGIVKI